MEKFKVLHIVGRMNVGGTETMILNLYRQVYKEIHFDFVSYDDTPGYYDEEIKKLGGRIIKLESPRERGFIGTIKDLVEVIKKDNYVAVHCHLLFNCGIGVLAAKIAGVKIRISHGHTTKDQEDGILRKIYIKIMRHLINRYSTSLLACSNGAGTYLFGEKVLKDTRYAIFPNVIQYKRFTENKESANLKKKLNLKEDDILIGHVGRFVEAKNHIFLVEIIEKMVKKNPGIHCVLIGEGELKGQVSEQVANLGLENHIHFLGLRKDMDKVFNDLSLLLFPSIYEGLGLVLLEAQASGVPCLASTAIQPEADMRVGLLKRLNLQTDIDIWVKTAMKMFETSEVNKRDIIIAFENKGYKKEDIISRLYLIYGISNEMRYDDGEEYINSLL